MPAFFGPSGKILLPDLIGPREDWTLGVEESNRRSLIHYAIRTGTARHSVGIRAKKEVAVGLRRRVVLNDHYAAVFHIVQQALAMRDQFRPGCISAHSKDDDIIFLQVASAPDPPRSKIRISRRCWRATAALHRPCR